MYYDLKSKKEKTYLTTNNQGSTLNNNDITLKQTILSPLSENTPKWHLAIAPNFFSLTKKKKKFKIK